MRMRATIKTGGRGGMALLLTLLITLMLAVMVYYAQIAAQVWSEKTQRELQRSRLTAAARDVAWMALCRLAADTDAMVDHTNETWAAGAAAEYPDGITATALVEDEERRMNINNLAVVSPTASNRSSFQALADLLSLIGRSDPAADVRALRQYVEAPLGKPAIRHESLAALEMQIGVDTEAWSKIAGLCSALPVTPVRAVPVNVNTAPPEALRACLGPGREAAVERLIALRKESPLVSLEPFEAVLGSSAFEEARYLLDTRSRYFSVVARSRQAENFKEVYALAERDDRGAVSILRWVER